MAIGINLQDESDPDYLRKREERIWADASRREPLTGSDFITEVLSRAMAYREEERGDFINSVSQLTDHDLRVGIYKIDNSIPAERANRLIEMARSEILRIQMRKR